MSFDLEVDTVEDGTRLDVMLVRRVEGMSRAKARRMIQDGLVRLNGRRARKGARLAAGEIRRLLHSNGSLSLCSMARARWIL